MNLPSKKKKTIGGFTLIELMVTIGIFVIMTAIIMAKYNSFYSGTMFKNVAYDTALAIRQAQTYGISVKVKSSAPTFGAAYGVSFGNNSASDSKTFNLNAFSKAGTGYAPIIPPEYLYYFKQGARVKSSGGLCIGTSSGSCTTEVFNLDIIFQRPNPEAIICFGPTGSKDCSTATYAKVTLVAADGVTTHTIEVNKVGQVVVK